MAVGPAVADDEGSVGSDASRGRKKGGTPKPAPGGKRNTVAGGRESRASTSASKKARGTMRRATRKVTMMAGMAKKDGDAGGDDDEAAKKKKKASARKRASTRAPYRKPKDGEWVEVWYDLRRKQDALGQRWQRWPRNEPGRRATLFGSTLYSTKRDHLASNGFYAHRTTHCLGDPGDPIPPEWLMIRPSRYEEIIMRATVEENWLLEMMVERQLKSLCRNRGALTIFHRFDEDGSGELDGSEFRSMLKSVGEEVDDKKVEWPPGREHGATRPTSKGSALGRVRLVSADLWTSDHPSGRSRRVDAFFRNARARHAHVEAASHLPRPAQVAAGRARQGRRRVRRLRRVRQVRRAAGPRRRVLHLRGPQAAPAGP